VRSPAPSTQRESKLGSLRITWHHWGGECVCRVAFRPFPVLQCGRTRQRVFAHLAGHPFLRGERADRAGARGPHPRLQLSGSGAPHPHPALATSEFFHRCHPRVPDTTGATQYRRGLERIVERIRELESKRRDLDETLAGLRALEHEAKERLDLALLEGSKKQRSKLLTASAIFRTL
jgi:hypothetical protein